jgi:hypothetical protein
LSPAGARYVMEKLDAARFAIERAKREAKKPPKPTFHVYANTTLSPADREARQRSALEEAARRRAEADQRVAERTAEFELGLEIIKLGYKAVAAKHHPDTGGSKTAMQRLNKVRERLRANS